MSNFEDVKPHFEQIWNSGVAIIKAMMKAAAEEAPVPTPEPTPTPTPTPEPVPTPEPTPVPTPEPAPVEPAIVAAQLANNTGGEWDKGVSNQVARFLLADTPALRTAFTKGTQVRFADGSVRTITSASAQYNAIFVAVDGAKLDPTKVGYPNNVEVIKAGEVIEETQNPTPAPPPTPAPAPAPVEEGDLPLFGLNLGGIGNNPWLSVINGIGNDKQGTHYVATKELHIACYAKNLDGKPWLARIPVAGERFIEKSFAPLNQKYVDEVVGVMDLVHKYGGKVVLDLHNYYRWWKKVDAPVAGRDNKTHNDHLGKGTATWTVINEADCPVSNAGLADLWVQICKSKIGQHPALLVLGLMNEPHNRGDGVDVNAKWPVAAQLCINEIRKVDTKHYISVGGNFYSSAKLWTKVSGALASLKDPADKLLHEAHQYMDKNGDGGGSWASHTDPVAADQGVKDWAAYFAWLEANNLRGYCGEVGGPATAGDYLTAVRRLMDEFQERRIPCTLWMGGTGQNDSYANGMNTGAGVLKPNAAPLMERIGRTVSAYGPKK